MREKGEKQRHFARVPVVPGNPYDRCLGIALTQLLPMPRLQRATAVLAVLLCSGSATAGIDVPAVGLQQGVPFSFTADGLAVNVDGPGWTRSPSSVAPVPGGTLAVTNFSTNFSCSGGGSLVGGRNNCGSTVVSFEERTFRIAPGAAGTLLRFRQVAGTSAAISAVNTLDVTLPIPLGAAATLHGFEGSRKSSRDFAETATPLPRGATVAAWPIGGRSSNGVLPFFGIHFNTTNATAGSGLVFSLGWSGSWLVNVSVDPLGRAVRVTAGLYAFDAALLAGQSFRAARVLAVNYSGSDVIVGWNAHRQLLARYYAPKDAAGRLRGGMVSSWTAQTYRVVNERDMLAMVTGNKAAGIESVWIDFSWYLGGSLSSVGNWKMPPTASVDPRKFPDGLQRIAEAAHAGPGPKQSFIVWFEPERAGAASYLGPGGPERATPIFNYTIHEDTGPYSGSYLLDLGHPPAREYMTNFLSSSVKTFELDVLRMDFNIDPADSWSLKDRLAARASGTPVQTGMAEAAHVEALYTMWQQILAENPGVLLDNCASGGRRLDLETATLSVPLWQSDLAGNPGDVSESWQSQTMGLSNFLPVHSGGCPRFDSKTTGGPTGEKGLTTAVEPYVWRSCSTVGKAIAWTPEAWATVATNDTLAAGIRKAVEETQRLRSIVSHVDAMYYPLTPIGPEHRWAAYQHQLNDTGFAVVFHRPPNTKPSQQSVLRAVSNRSAFTWVSTRPTGSPPGYFRGDYDTNTANITSLEGCKGRCAGSLHCSGFTFVPNGGPPCALYTSIDGPFEEMKTVVQFAKLFSCHTSSTDGTCVYGLDSFGNRHAVQTDPKSPFLSGCDASYVRNCAGAVCDQLLAAPDGPPGCPPYPSPRPNSSGQFELKLRGLSPSTLYDVSFYNESYLETAAMRMTGAALSSFTIILRSRSSLLLWLQPVLDSIIT